MSIDNMTVTASSMAKKSLRKRAILSRPISALFSGGSMIRNNRKKLALTIATLAGFSLAAPHSANAATYYWDNNGTTAGFGTAGLTWADPTIGDSTMGWSTDGTGVTLPGTVSTLTTDSLNFGNGATGLAAGTITVSGTVNSGDLTFASGSGAIVLAGDTINLADTTTITVNNTTNTISAALSGAATTLTKAGTGNLTLSGANNFLGNLILSAGTLSANTNATALGNGSLTLNGGTLSLNNTTGLAFNNNTTIGGNVSIVTERNVPAAGVTYTMGTLALGANPLTVSGGNVTSGIAGLTFGATTISGPLNANITNPVANGAMTFVTLGAVSDGGGGHGIVKSGNGKLVISADSTYTGNNTVNAGILQFNTPGAIGGTGRNITVAPGASVAAGYAIDNAFLNRIAENGNAFNVVLASANGLAASSANNLDFSSSTGANLPNAVLAGLGSITTNNAAAAYSGTITPNGTTYRFGNVSTTFQYRNADVFTVTSPLTGGNSVVITGTAPVYLTNAALAYSGTTTIRSGALLGFDTVSIDGIGGGPTVASIIMEANSTLLRRGGNLTNAFLKRIVSTTNPITIIGNNASVGALDFSGTNGGQYLPNASLALWDQAGTATFTVGLITPADNVYRFGDPRNGNNINLTLANTLTGARALVVNGGNLRLMNSSDMTGNITINAGTFTIGSPVGNNAATAGYGQMGGGNYAGAILNNGTLAHTSNLDQTFSGVISGTGSVTKITTTSTGGSTVTHGLTSTLTLTNTNTYSGTTTVQAGNLVVGSNAPSGAPGALGNATSDVNLGQSGSNNNASLLIGGAFTVGRNIRNATADGSDAGTRTLTLGGNTAANSVISGNVILGSLNNSSKGISLTAAAGGQVTISGAIQDPTGQDAGEQLLAATTTAVTKVGAGTVVLSGANTFLGGTAVNAGTLTLDYSSQDNSKLADLAPLTFGGGTVNLSGGTHLELVGSTTINPGISALTRSSGTAKLALGAITPVPGGTINFGASNIATTTNTNDATGILGIYATVGGTDWAANDGSGNVVAYTGYVDINARGPSTIADAASSNVRILGNGTSGNINLGAATTTINSLVQQNSSFAATVNTAGGTLNVSAILLGTGQEALTIGTAPGSGTLSVGNPGSEMFLINNNTGKNLTVNSAIADNSNSSLTKLGAGTVILNGTNTYNGVTTINAGTLTINGANTNSGGVTLNNGTLVFGNALALGSSTLTINGGAVEATGTVVTATPVLANADFSIVGTGSLTLGDATLSAARIITNNTTAGVTSFSAINGSSTPLTFAGSGNTAVNGIITTGTGTVTQSGSGVVTLLGDNSYTGVTNITSGTLNLAGNRTATMSGINVGNATGNAVLGISADVPMGANVITVGGGTGTGGLGTVNHTAGTVSFTSGTQLLVGNLSMDGVYNLSGGTLSTAGVANRGIILGVNTGRTGTFNLSGTGTLTMAATSVLQIGRSENTTATSTTGIFNQTGGTATVGDLRIGGSSAGATGTANATGTLNISAGTFAATTFSQLSGSNNSVSTINISGTADVTLPAFPTARGTGSTATITFNGGTLKNAAASATYMGGLTNAFIKAGGAKFDTTNGNITITQALLTDAMSLGGGLTKDGSNTLTLTGTNTYTGTTTVSAGTLQVGNGGATGDLGTGPVVNNASLVVNRTGTLTTGTIDGTGTTTVTATGANLTAGRVRQATLDIGAGNKVTVATNGGNSGTSTLTNLNINATGKLDLANNDLIVDNGNLATLTSKLATGLDINGTYGNGPGITSSAFASNPNFNTVLGIAANVELGYTSFSGQTVDANDILIKYTYYGDADLSGSVDTSTDFDLYITGLTSGGSLGGWLFGDFDYSGTVDSSTDFDLYITGLTTQGGPLLTAGGGGNLVQAVPEPSTFVLGGLALLGFAGMGLRRRRMAK